ncbi:MAG: GNAT family N-acetyltransferase [Pirellulaceae bacterium]|nr:GNAT family N-acetyltransferase [Pirellulaceae bacterium]
MDVRQLLAACGLSGFRFDHVPVENGWTEVERFYLDQSYWVCLDQGYASYLCRLQSRHRQWCQQLERKKRKLAREVGSLRFELHTENHAVLQALIEWKQQQILAAGWKNVFHSPWARDLLKETVREQTPNFAGWLSALYAGSQLVAVHLGQRSGQVLNAWIPTHHPEFSSYSPGALLHLELLRCSSERGITHINLGRGENPLKVKLANSTSQMAIGAIFRNQWRQRMARTLFHTKKWLVGVYKRPKSVQGDRQRHKAEVKCNLT